MKAFFIFLIFVILCQAKYGDAHFAEFVEKALSKQRIELIEDLQERFNPMVQTHMCIYGSDYDQHVSKVYESGTVLFDIVTNGVLHIGAISGQSERKEFKSYIKVILDRFFQLGFDVSSKIHEYDNGFELISALNSGEIDLIYPSFYTNELYGRRLESLNPICTGVGLELAYYTNADMKTGVAQPAYKNMKELVEATLNTDKKIVIFRESVRDILLKLYPMLDKGSFKIADTPDDTFTFLADSRYSAVFVDVSFKPKTLEANHVNILKNFFVVPLEMYTRVENPYIMVPEDAEFKIHHKGNNVLLHLLDYIIYKFQKSNSHFSFSYDDRSVTMGDCIGNKPKLPEEIKQSGIIQRLIGEKTIRVGYVVTDTPLLRAQIVNNFSEVSGPFFKYENKIFAALGDLLHLSKFNVEPIVYETAEDLFYALDKGAIDVTSASMLEGGSINGIERRLRYQFTCSTGGWPLTLVTSKKVDGTKSIKSFDDLKAYISKNSGKFAVRNSNMASLLTDALNLDVKYKIVNSDSEGFDLVHEGKDYVAYIPEYLLYVPDNMNLNLIHTNQYVATTMFLRKDRKHTKNYEISSGIYVATVLLSILLGILLFIIVFAIIKYIAGRKKAQDTYQIINDDAKTNANDGLQSLGDEEDPDYIAPSF